VAIVTLKHLTSYLYAHPVALGPHRLMVRPRESFDQHLLEATLEITPKPAELRWLQDVFGNSVAIAQFNQRARELRVESTVVVLHTPVKAEDLHVEGYARKYPFTYSSEDMPDLVRSIERHHYDPDRVVDSWAKQFVRSRGATGTLRMLRRMTAYIHDEFTYLARYEKGTQTPMETIARRRGTCRDFAVLMIEAARALGLAARFVSGYLYDPEHHEPLVGGGNTHAWVRIFLPGSGWIEFDPTNGIVGNAGLIRVAIARDPRGAVPISGIWRGFPADNLGLKVTVDVHCRPEAPLQKLGTDGKVPLVGDSDGETEPAADPDVEAVEAVDAEPEPASRTSSPEVQRETPVDAGIGGAAIGTEGSDSPDIDREAGDIPRTEPLAPSVAEQSRPQ
jgi:transglutaminase-like putative cysteine protease